MNMQKRKGFPLSQFLPIYLKKPKKSPSPFGKRKIRRPNPSENPVDSGGKRKKRYEEILVTLKGELLVGFHSVRLALENPNREFHQIFVNPSGSEKIQEILDFAQRKNIQVKECNRKQLKFLTDLGNIHTPCGQ